ncbi:hypothetical protein B0T26DRAFT_774350 [Lasiosphaeria miniovina]|uniref:C2H2-type domain-containing protein n=1 Tax=Lasiosphaeria miniovina TaxID=1954250 RepID=A0AA40AJA9_9PEZI|nr:uncharacterized protein B0T26DRAFT_774350 [Lasiosphaeria miniovina]KAK0716864.1 hypothetical protein B0T26DRAFT_774350 [Lasiosphaeria miniovina]
MQYLTPKFKLSREQQFDKLEATSGDIRHILAMAWTDAVQTDPDTRLDFCMTLILCGITGFRPGALVEIFYKQIELAAVRDPDNLQNTKIIAHITLFHNKQNTGSLRTEQDDIIEFCVAFVPDQSIHLLSHIVARALSEDAFEAGYKSVDELFRRPNLEHVNQIPLKWKDELITEDRLFVSIGYNQYWKIWRRATWALGLRDTLRPYSTRVGAGATLNERLDVGRLRSSVQDTIRSGASQRQVNRVRAKLQGRVKKLATMKATQRRAKYEKESDSLRARGLKTTALRPIPTAPSPATSSLGAKAIGIFLKRVELGDIHRSARFITILIAYLRHRPSSVAVLVTRETGSSLDLSMHGIAPIGISQCLLGCPSFANPRNLTRHVIKCHFKKGTFDAPFECPECLWLGEHITITGPSAWSAHIAREHHCPEPNPNRAETFPCWLCKLSFSNTKGRSQHVTATHFRRGTFNDPQDCLECERQGVTTIVAGLDAWRHHEEEAHNDDAHNDADELNDGWNGDSVEHLCIDREQHGEENDLGFPCRLCGKPFASPKGRTLHTTNFHFRQDQGNTGPCLECSRNGLETTMIEDLTEWQYHEKTVHAEKNIKYHCRLCDKRLASN